MVESCIDLTFECWEDDRSKMEAFDDEYMEFIAIIYLEFLDIYLILKTRYRFSNPWSLLFTLENNDDPRVNFVKYTKFYIIYEYKPVLGVYIQTLVYLS